MRRCVFVIGTRAQLVKAAPVLNYGVDAGLDHVVWMTGQHDVSIDDLIADFGIRSRIVFPELREERPSIGRLVTWFPGQLRECRDFLRAQCGPQGEKPIAVVHGDTLSTWLGAMAARSAGADVVHLESGLSSGAMFDPFPEEILRRLTFRLTDVALCPNDDACERMRRYDGCKVVHTGENTLLDCVRDALASEAAPAIDAPDPYFVASIHRFQNLYRRPALTMIVDELISIAADCPLYFILHPPTELRLRKYGLYARLEDVEGIKLRQRMPYRKFLALIASARAVFSDGGSNQEELSYLGVPTILFRNRSERPDGIGSNIRFYGPSLAPLRDFVESGRLDSMRSESRLADAARPSQVSVETLLSMAEKS